jgi:large subunit ribosomal protein L24
MQRILKRAATLHKQEARKIAAKKRTEFKAERFNLRRQTKGQREMVVEQIVAARDAQREDWKLGPLAPNRRYGREGEAFGGIDRDAITPLPLPEDLQIKDWNIVEGDRVVILRGLDKGQIGRVKQLHKESNSLSVEGLNMVCIGIASLQTQPGVLIFSSRHTKRNPSSSSV